jgi:hypothetical protein
LAPLCGNFINVMCAHLDIHRADTIANALSSSQAAMSLALRTNVPLIYMIDKLRSTKHFYLDSSRNPCYQSLCNLQTNRRPDIKNTSLDIENLTKFQDVNFCEGQVDIDLMMQQRHDAILGQCHFATALFKTRTIEQFNTHFAALSTHIPRGQQGLRMQGMQLVRPASPPPYQPRNVWLHGLHSQIL